MKHIIFFISFSLFVSIHLFGQITLEECRQRTIENYPLIRQYELIEKAQDFNIENASRGYIPQLSMSAKASYQSEVTKIPFDMPGVDMKGMPKAQYQVMLELQQTIWDGGAIHSKKKLTEVSSQVDREQVSVNLYALNDRVDQLYFGVLLLNEQLIQNSLYIEDLQIFSWKDDGKSYGRGLGEGKIGFRQMAPLVAEYANLKITQILDK